MIRLLQALAVLCIATLAAPAFADPDPATNSPPVVEHFRTIPPSFQLIFKFTGGGLVSKTGDNVEGFQIAGVDRKFYPASARIIGETLRLSSPDVKVPVAARYTWGTNMTSTLYGRNDRPVAPFRTDVWPDQP